MIRRPSTSTFTRSRLCPGSGLARLYPAVEVTRVNSIHHQAVKVLGSDLKVEALSVPDKLVEAVRWQGASYVLGVQWHPEFHDPGDSRLLDVFPLLKEFLAEARRVKQASAETVKA